MKAARDAFPGHTRFHTLYETLQVDLGPDTLYLAGHGLLELNRSPSPLENGYRITSKGIDFLEDDGGLSAILGVVTVKLHADTLRDLLLQRAADAVGDSTVKGKVLEQLKALPAEGIQLLGQKLMAEGLQRLPNALQWLQTALPQG